MSDQQQNSGSRLGCLGWIIAGVIVFGIFGVASGGDDDGSPTTEPREPRQELQAQPADDFDYRDELSLEEAVDFMTLMGLDLDEFCSSWEFAQASGTEDLAFESFSIGYEGAPGYSTQEVFDELTSRC